jgi:hypothetical protein
MAVRRARGLRVTFCIEKEKSKFMGVITRKLTRKLNSS